MSLIESTPQSLTLSGDAQGAVGEVPLLREIAGLAGEAYTLECRLEWLEKRIEQLGRQVTLLRQQQGE